MSETERWENVIGRHSSAVLRERVRDVVRRADGRTVRFDLFNEREKGVVQDELERVGWNGSHLFSLVCSGPAWDGMEYGSLAEPTGQNKSDNA